MKRFECAEETGTDRACEKCRKRVVLSKGTEVEYKDCEIFEPLYIKMARRLLSVKTMNQLERAVKKKGARERHSAEMKTSGKKTHLVLTALSSF